MNRRTDDPLLQALHHLYGDAALGDDAIVVTAVRRGRRAAAATRRVVRRFGCAT